MRVCVQEGSRSLSSPKKIFPKKQKLVDKRIKILYITGKYIFTGKGTFFVFGVLAMSSLIIAEKKALADAILAAIPGHETKYSGYTEKGDYVVTWASGHLLALKAPEDYRAELKTWSLDALPVNFENWGVKINQNGMGGDAREKVKLIGELLKKTDAVIHAGDPDEEGQLIVDEILRWHSYTGPVYRLATGDTTKASLQKALKSMDDNAVHESAGWSAYARSVADYMVGINVSRFFSLMNRAVLTVGRVQTPTLGLVVARQKLIDGHKTITYYEIIANTEKDGITFQSKYVPDPNDQNLTDGMILNKAYAESIAKQLCGLSAQGNIIEKNDKESPPLPFDLGHLQSYCSTHFGYNISDTLAITQSLRDKYNAISYNRTDTRYLPENCFAEAPSTIAQVLKNSLLSPSSIDSSIHSRCFNDKNVEAHFAIIPQNVSVDIGMMSPQERNVYLAICKYYLVQFMPPAQKRKLNLTIPVPFGGKLVANETIITDPGYLTMLGKDKGSEEEKRIPLHKFSPGSAAYNIVDSEIAEKETKPPAYYTQATLNEDMTRIAKYVDDPEVKRLLLEKDKDKKQENGSIGTVATRASIINGLIKKGFLAEEKKGKTERLIATPLGIELCRILPDDLVKPNLTAYWWVIQEDIRTGKADPKVLQDNVLDMIQDIISSPHPTIDPNIAGAKRSGNNGSGEELGNCPWCGNVVRENKYGFSCVSKDCKFIIRKKAKGGILRNTTFTASDAKAFLKGKIVKKTTLCKNDGGSFTGNLTLKNEVSPYGATFDLTFDTQKKGQYHKRKK